MNKIWSEIYKPDQFKHSKPSDFFHFEFCMLPHKIFEEEKFVQKCKALRNRFDENEPDSLFPRSEVGKTIPLDGLSIFIQNTWEKIRTQKELNLPDQRVMVANLRCNELKEEALEVVSGELKKLRTESERGLIEGFNFRCTEIIKMAITHFDEYAHQYDQKVYEKTRKDLASILTGQSLFYCFENQIKMLRKDIFSDFEKQVIHGFSAKDQVNENFSQITKEGYQNSIKRFKKISETFIVDGTSWGQQVMADEAELVQ